MNSITCSRQEYSESVYLWQSPIVCIGDVLLYLQDKMSKIALYLLIVTDMSPEWGSREEG